MASRFETIELISCVLVQGTGKDDKTYYALKGTNPDGKSGLYFFKSLEVAKKWHGSPFTEDSIIKVGVAKNSNRMLYIEMVEECPWGEKKIVIFEKKVMPEAPKASEIDAEDDDI